MTKTRKRVNRIRNNMHMTLKYQVSDFQGSHAATMTMADADTGQLGHISHGQDWITETPQGRDSHATSSYLHVSAVKEPRPLAVPESRASPVHAMNISSPTTRTALWHADRQWPPDVPAEEMSIIIPNLQQSPAQATHGSSQNAHSRLPAWPPRPARPCPSLADPAVRDSFPTLRSMQGNVNCGIPRL